MEDRGKADIDEVVRAFVLAEAHPLSVLADDWLGPWFSARGISLADVQRRLRDTNDVEMLRLARQALAEGRGFGPNDRGIFNGFPAAADWRSAHLSPVDFTTMLYLALPPWTALSRNTLLVREGAAALENCADCEQSAIDQRVTAIASLIRNGGSIEPLILAQERDGPLVLIDGHHRATALVLSGITECVPAFVARVDSFGDWVFANALGA